jgi:hypothetical protein
MVRHRQEDRLDSWLEKVKTSGLPALTSFANGLLKDENGKPALTVKPEEFLQDLQSGNLPAIYWARWNQGDVDVAKYKRFTYGSLLLPYRSTATRFQYGGPWGLDKPDKLMFWGFGSPTTNPSGVSALLDGATGLYVRTFTHGMIIVNPTHSSHTFRVPSGYYDVIHTTTSGLPKLVSGVTVAARDAAFLLKP